MHNYCTASMLILRLVETYLQFLSVLSSPLRSHTSLPSPFTVTLYLLLTLSTFSTLSPPPLPFPPPTLSYCPPSTFSNCSPLQHTHTLSYCPPSTLSNSPLFPSHTVVLPSLHSLKLPPLPLTHSIVLPSLHPLKLSLSPPFYTVLIHPLLTQPLTLPLIMSSSFSLTSPCSPTLGDDFLSELGLHTIHCLVGGQSSKLASRPSSCGNVERLHLYPSDQLITGLNVDTVIHQIRIITEVCVYIHVCVYVCVL